MQCMTTVSAHEGDVYSVAFHPMQVCFPVPLDGLLRIPSRHFLSILNLPCVWSSANGEMMCIESCCERRVRQIRAACRCACKHGRQVVCGSRGTCLSCRLLASWQSDHQRVHSCRATSFVTLFCVSWSFFGAFLASVVFDSLFVQVEGQHDSVLGRRERLVCEDYRQSSRRGDERRNEREWPAVAERFKR